MTRATRKCAFAEAVLAMLEGATLVEHRRQDWFSATFAGERHSLSLRLTGGNAAQRAEAFSKAITTHEFTLTRRFVADIAVTGMKAGGGGVGMEVEALLLEE